MKDGNKTKVELIKELGILEQQITKLQKSNKQYKKLEQELKKYDVNLENLLEKGTTASRESKDLLDKIVNLNPDWIFIKDKNYRHIMVNEGYASGVGKSVEDLIGKDDIEIGFPEELIFGNPDKGITGFRNDDKRVLKGETIHNEYDSATAADGTLHIFDTYKIPLRDRNGNIYAVLGYSHDITDHIQAEQVIQESENRFRGLFNHMSSGLAIYEAKDNGRDFIIKDFNQAAEKIEKVKKEDIVGKNILKIFPGVKDFGLFKVFQEVYKTGKPQNHPISFYKDQRIAGWKENYVYKLPSGEIVAVYDDITERKQAEKALAESEEKYRTVFENTGTATVIIEENTIISLANVEFEKLTGYTKKEIENKKSWTEFVVKEDLEKMKQTHKLRRQDREKVLKEWEFHLKDKNGNIKNIFIKTDLIPGTKRSVTSLMDITHRKKVEEALKKSRQLLNTTERISKTGGWEHDVQSQKFTWTDEVYRLHEVPFDYDTNVEKGISFYKPEDQQTIERYFKKAIEDGEPYDLELPFITAKGKHLWVRTIGRPVQENNKTIKIVGNIQDITERKKAEENVKTAKDELQIILDSVPAIIFYKDTEGRIIRTNKALADSLKVPIKDIVGKTTEELFPKEQAENMRKDDKEVMISGKSKRDIIQPYTTPDGIRWLISDKIPYKDKEGKVIGVIGLSKDITVQRNEEQELKQTYQRLKKTMDAAIDTMSKIIEAKDPYTSGHQHRVCQLAVPLARELGLPPDKVEGIRIASLIHDIGKIGLPTEILSKPSKLTDIEFSLIKDHSQVGYDILKSIDFSYPIAQIVLQHHERLDGSGYPNNLKGDKILLEAKIIGIADVVEAMSSFRPYRPALGIDAALEEIIKNKGILYDPKVVDVCLKLFKNKRFKFES